MVPQRGLSSRSYVAASATSPVLPATRAASEGPRYALLRKVAFNAGGTRMAELACPGVVPVVVLKMNLAAS